MRDSAIKRYGKKIWGWVFPYLLTIGIVLSVGFFKYFLNQALDIKSPILLFFTAIAIATWFSGFGQGVFAIFIALIFSNFMLEQPTDLRTDPAAVAARFGLFAVDSLLVVYVCARFRKVARRMAANDEVARAKHFLESVVENIPNMIFIKDAVDLKFIVFNKAGENLVGYKREDLIGKSDDDLFPPEQAAAFRAKDREVLAGDSVVVIPDEVIETKNGPRRLSTKKIPIKGRDGEPKYLLGVSEDITDRKELEAQRASLVMEQAARIEAEKTARRFAFLSESTAALTKSLDAKVMLISLANSIANEMADFCVITAISDGDERPEVTMAAAAGIPYKLDQDWIKRLEADWNMNERRPKIYREDEKSVMFVPIQTYSRQIGSIAIISMNSARRFDDVDLSMAEDLARRAFFAIDNALLYQKAQEASSAKSSFVANISHEIRTPLGAMLGFTEMLLHGEQVSEKQRHFLQTIERNGQQLLKIVDEILDISKVESQKIDFEPVTFSLKNLLSEVMMLLQTSAAKKKLALNLDVPADLADNIISDPTRLRQILINLIGNAIKFTEKGAVSVTVEMRDVNGGKNLRQLEISVRDTGIGMTAKQAAQLFQPFSQADSSMARRFGGTGLGLFLSRKLAELLGGNLQLKQTATGKGSEFVLTTMVEVAVAKAVGDARVAGDSAVQKPLTGRVLVVDDSADNREWMEFACKSLGVEADTVGTGEEAVQKVSDIKYDAVLMDIQMPDMDGFKALKIIRSLKYNGPVVAVTAHAMKGDREKFLNQGFSDYLGKPLTRPNLEACLRRNIKPES